MRKRANHGNEQMVRMALTLIDMRAHFEAQLRTVTRAERGLRKCRSATGPSFQAAADELRRDLELLATNNRSLRPVLEEATGSVRALRPVK